MEELHKMKSASTSAPMKFSSGGIVSKDFHCSVLKEAAEVAESKRPAPQGWKTKRKGKSRNYSLLRLGAKLKASPV
eukprot:CAMPEP_0206183036 /NCGR_PEP_ID=MMETSP0166-20121206/406_1 /ASSEMBLY_ACC=CAM_ASM_000260 /TAXON_ID=95228 /ORGANISM="Vannella robusta, Strain DIVA3 518/3/11/1/6" /LENGTH=75 /DNA_ID=CAMNT_0053597829 /DNA_START=343 /DNA_END=566 /DNA_ORIENTATION=-